MSTIREARQKTCLRDVNRMPCKGVMHGDGGDARYSYLSSSITALGRRMPCTHVSFFHVMLARFEVAPLTEALLTKPAPNNGPSQ